MSGADTFHQDSAGAVHHPDDRRADRLGWYYLRIPSLQPFGIGQYELKAELPRSGGLYATSNVTYRGTQIGKVISVEPTDTGAIATMSIDDRYKIPADATANVHSVSAIGEQYLDLVSTGNPGQYLSPGYTIPVDRSTVPSEVGPALDAANEGLAVLPKEKIDALLTETANAVGGLGPSLQRLVDSTTNLAVGIQGEPAPGQRHHREFGAHPGQPGAIRGRDRAVVAEPEHAGLAVRPAGRRAAQRACSRRRRRWTRYLPCSAGCVTRCRRPSPIFRSSSTCSSATTRASSRRW